jgi:hypothetical protein
MKRRVTTVGLIGILILGFNARVVAYHTSLGPPLITDDAGTEPRGVFEWGTAFIHTGSPGFYTGEVVTALTTGLTDKLEVFVAPEVYDAIWGSDVKAGGELHMVTGGHGSVYELCDDIWVGAKYQFREEKGSAPAIACRLKIKFPGRYEDEGLTSGEMDEEVALCLTKSFGKGRVLGMFPKLQLDVNIGYRDIGVPSLLPGMDWADEVRYSASVMYPIMFPGFSLKDAPWRGILLCADLVGMTNKTEGNGDITFEGNILDAYLGLKQYITPSFQYKAGIGARLSATAPDYLVYFAPVYYF